MLGCRNVNRIRVYDKPELTYESVLDAKGRPKVPNASAGENSGICNAKNDQYTTSGLCERAGAKYQPLQRQYDPLGDKVVLNLIEQLGQQFSAGFGQHNLADRASSGDACVADKVPPGPVVIYPKSAAAFSRSSQIAAEEPDLQDLSQIRRSVSQMHEDSRERLEMQRRIGQLEVQLQTAQDEKLASQRDAGQQKALADSLYAKIGVLEAALAGIQASASNLQHIFQARQVGKCLLEKASAISQALALVERAIATRCALSLELKTAVKHIERLNAENAALKLRLERIGQDAGAQRGTVTEAAKACNQVVNCLNIISKKDALIAILRRQNSELERYSFQLQHKIDDAHRYSGATEIEKVAPVM